MFLSRLRLFQRIMNLSTDATELVKTLAKYDATDLAAGIGALQLMPENADKLLRLEAAATLIGGLAPGSGRPRMGRQRWRQWLNGLPLGTPPFVLQEDPFERPFTEAFTF